MEQIFIRGVELPAKVRGVVLLDEEGDYDIYINTVLSEACQREAARHEICHIRKNHFFKDEPVVIDELQAGGL